MQTQFKKHNCLFFGLPYMQLCLTHFLTFIVTAVMVQLYKERTKPLGWIRCLHIWHKPSNNENPHPAVRLTGELLRWGYSLASQGCGGSQVFVQDEFIP